MGVGFQQPLGGQPRLAHKSRHGVRAGGAAAPGFGVVVQHRIDDGAGAAVVHDVGDGSGDGIEKGLDVRIHGRQQLTIYIFK
ncbi:hypothetical protein G6F31_021043 [Rhizopus arrhizus]|nr:hypothetical protein G6F31_021043 [Rhizopus arrhizus]